jgi:hypothetical protein
VVDPAGLHAGDATRRYLPGSATTLTVPTVSLE